LIITEASAVAIGGKAYYGAPGPYTDEQVRRWKTIVDGVHAKGGKLFAQLPLLSCTSSHQSGLRGGAFFHVFS